MRAIGFWVWCPVRGSPPLFAPHHCEPSSLGIQKTWSRLSYVSPPSAQVTVTLQAKSVDVPKRVSTDSSKPTWSASVKEARDTCRC